MKRAFFPLVLAVLLIFTGPSFSRQDDIQIERARRCTVLIGAPSGGVLGSGTIISGGRILTMFHVVARHRDVMVQYRDGEVVRGAVIAHDAYADLALVEVQNAPKYPVATLRRESVAVGEQLFGVGSTFVAGDHTTQPLIFTWSLTFGRVVHEPITVEGVSFIATQSSALQGYSGGGLYDLTGLLVGLHKARLPGTVSYAIAADTIREFLIAAGTN